MGDPGFTIGYYANCAMTKKSTDIPRKMPIRKGRVIIWVLVFFVVLEIGTRLFFLQPGLTSRNIEKGAKSMDYLWSQMDRHEGEDIAWVGSSVLQGFLNVDNGKTFVDMVERRLRKTEEFGDARCYNLSAAGNNFGDHYCVLTETMRHDPDLVIVAIHFKLFSQHNSANHPIRRPELVAYIADDPRLPELLKRFQMNHGDFWKYRMDHWVRNVWAFYRYHELMLQIPTNTGSSPVNQIKDWYFTEMDIYSEDAQEARIATAEDHNVDYLWKLLPEKLVLKNYQICSTLDFSDSNINWRTFKDLCELGKKKKANMLFYLTPINRAFVEEKNFFDWKMLNGYKQAIARQVLGNGHRLIDLTNTVDPAYFSDTDHINMNGHRQVSRRMTKEAKKALRQGQRRGK
jgi:hypothetical protein